MKETQNSELSKAKKTAATEPKKTTPPTSQTKSNIQTKKAANTSLPSSQKPAAAASSAPTAQKKAGSSAQRKSRVRPLQTVTQAQRSNDDAFDEALDDASALMLVSGYHTIHSSRHIHVQCAGKESTACAEY